MNWKRTFAFAFAAQFLGIVGISFATPFLPFFVAEVGVEEGGRQAFWAGIVMASGGLTFALFAPFWGGFWPTVTDASRWSAGHTRAVHAARPQCSG